MKGRLRIVLPAVLVAIVLVVGAAQFVDALAAKEGCPTLAFRDRLFDATFAGDSDAWVVGYPGVILHSPDAGKTWKRACDFSDQALFAVDFVGTQVGWAVGRAGRMFSTEDGGANWKDRGNIGEEPFFDVDFVDEDFGVAVGNFGAVARTVDGGATWINEVLAPMSNAQINSVFFFDHDHGFVAGEYPAWELALDEDVLVDTLSNLFETKDGGKTWQVVDAATHFALNDVKFADAQRGWAVGAKGTLIRTTDGGATWAKIPTGVTVNLFNVAISPGATWAVGSAGTLIKIVGDKVEVVDLKAFSWLSSVAFSPTGNGVIVGGRGLLYSTTDGGASWSKLRATH
jgi:photosystem II stability/assembly factor-like uncharacterized protein